MAKVSVIVPVRKIDKDISRLMIHLATQPDIHETFIVTDEICPGFPAAKRNWAMQRATGDIYAFIDSDAYPSKDWLKNAIHYLQVFDAVCGPGVLPPDSPKAESVADKVHEWLFCPYRVKARKPQIVSWFPTFNLIVKKEVASQFDNYLTGEDDRFGLTIKDGIFYHPSILVYHNRRGAFRPLWTQFGRWARHKGAFNGMAFVAWVTTLWTYAVNFVIGFFRRKP